MKTMCEKDSLLYQISVLDFVVIDLTEYLDTHPADQKAIQYFNHYNKLKNKASEEFAQKYYPLTLSNAANCGDIFKWAEAPMPWEC